MFGLQPKWLHPLAASTCYERHPWTSNEPAPSLLTTSSEKRACNSSAGGMGALNSSSCRGTLSLRLISGGSLLLKQHRKPRPGRVLFLGGMLAAGTQVPVTVAKPGRQRKGPRSREGQRRGGRGRYLGGIFCKRERGKPLKDDKVCQLASFRFLQCSQQQGKHLEEGKMQPRYMD